MDVIRQLAEEFLDRNLDLLDSDGFIPKARAAAHDIDAKADRVLFITLVMQGITKPYEAHLPCNNANCGWEGPYQKVSYFLRQELARLDVVIDQDAFTTSERDAMNERLDTILNELALIKEGQGVVAEDVEDLKDLMYLGKPKWHRQFIGTVSEWVASGMVTEATARPLLGVVRNALNQLPALSGL